MDFRARVFISGAIMIATLCACSSISSKQSYSYPLPLKASEVLSRYQQAKFWSTRDAGKSCALWREILAERSFPLASIARLRAMEVCDAEAMAFPPIDEVMAETPEPWLSELLLRSTLARAKRTKNKAWEQRLSFKVADLEKLQSEKLVLLNRALSLSREAGDAAAAAAAQAKISAIAPRFDENPPPERWLAVAADFRQARQFEKAREYYQKVVDSENLETLDKLKALDGIRLSYKLQKNIDAYLTASKIYSDFADRELLKQGLKETRAKKTNANGKLLIGKYFETRITLARAVWTEDSPREAANILKAAENQVKHIIPVEDSVLLRARIEEEAGHFANTVSLLKEVRPDKIVNRETRLKILWSLAWNQRKLGQLKESAAAFEDLIAQEDSTSAASRDRFWFAKTLSDLGDADKAKENFNRLTTDDPMSWYALLAYREMKKEIPALTPNPERAPASVTLADSAFLPDERLTLEWLVSTDEQELARRFLDQISRERKRSYSDTQTADLMNAYVRANYFQPLFMSLYDLPVEQRSVAVAGRPRLFFPQPWPELVKNASAKFGVQPELIYSIMRQESSFNPLARSSADAFGLMQLIPEMAKRAEKTSGLKISSHEDLYQPETNIPLGAAFVRDLLDRWNGSFIPTVASYNASEKAIIGWVRTRYRGDALTFIEDIPYEETRNYIKLVMRNYIFYQRLNSGGGAIVFPEWCLANLQDVKP